MRKLVATTLLILGTASVALAQTPATLVVPEIDAASAVAALGLITGAILVLRGRGKK
jgi:hypothetical protein